MPNPHSLTAYQVQSTTLREGGRNAFAAFVTIPKPQLDFQKALKKVSVYWRKIAERLLSSKMELGLHNMYRMTKI